jgi:hypothetical protein
MTQRLRRLACAVSYWVLGLFDGLDMRPPPAREVIVGLMFTTGILLFFSSYAYADALSDHEPVSAAQVAEILGLLFSFLLSACTLAYSAGWLRQEVTDHRRRINEVERECRLARSDAVAIASKAAAEAAAIAAAAAKANAEAAASLAAIKAQLDLILAGRITPGNGKA